MLGSCNSTCCYGGRICCLSGKNRTRLDYMWIHVNVKLCQIYWANEVMIKGIMCYDKAKFKFRRQPHLLHHPLVPPPLPPSHLARLITVIIADYSRKILPLDCLQTEPTVIGITFCAAGKFPPTTQAQPTVSQQPGGSTSNQLLSQQPGGSTSNQGAQQQPVAQPATRGLNQLPKAQPATKWLSRLP